MIRIIFDTNALLDLYKYSEDTLNSILDELDDTSKYEIVILDRVYKEFEKNRKEVVNNPNARNPIKEFEGNMRKTVEEIKKKLKSLHYNNLSKTYSTNMDTIIDEFIGKDFNNFSLNLNKECGGLLNANIIDKAKNDPLIVDFVNKHYNASTNLIDKWLNYGEKAKLRAELHIPPYDPKDNVKEGSEDDYFAKYGDYIVWFELLENIKNIPSTDVYFIENERKVAFWKNEQYTEFFPFLLNEVKEKCIVKSFNTLSLSNFIISIQNCFNSTVIQEVKSIRNEFEKIYTDDSYIKSFYESLELPDFELELDDLIGEEVEYGNIDEINDLDLDTYNVLYDKKEILVDEDCYGSIEVSIPVEYVVNAIATLYYGTGEDYEPNDFSCKIRYKYIQKLFFTYSVNTNGLVTITPGDDSYSCTSIRLIYDSFTPLMNYDEEDNCGKYGNCTVCGTPLNDYNFSNQGNGNLCDECLYRLNKLEEDD